MTNGGSTDDPETLSTRRGFLSKAGVAAGTALVGGAATGIASAQTGNEPRINLGDNFYIDDVDGETLAVKDPSDGSTVMEYDATAGSWTLPAVITDGLTLGTHDIGAILEASASGQRIDHGAESFTGPTAASDDTWGSATVEPASTTWATAFSASPEVLTSMIGQPRGIVSDCNNTSTTGADIRQINYAATDRTGKTSTVNWIAVGDD